MGLGALLIGSETRQVHKAGACMEEQAGLTGLLALLPSTPPAAPAGPLHACACIHIVAKGA